MAPLNLTNIEDGLPREGDGRDLEGISDAGVIIMASILGLHSSCLRRRGL